MTFIHFGQNNRDASQPLLKPQRDYQKSVSLTIMGEDGECAPRIKFEGSKGVIDYRKMVSMTFAGEDGEYGPNGASQPLLKSQKGIDARKYITHAFGHEGGEPTLEEMQSRLPDIFKDDGGLGSISSSYPILSRHPLGA